MSITTQTPGLADTLVAEFQRHSFGPFFGTPCGVLAPLYRRLADRAGRTLSPRGWSVSSTVRMPTTNRARSRRCTTCCSCGLRSSRCGGWTSSAPRPSCPRASSSGSGSSVRMSSCRPTTSRPSASTSPCAVTPTTCATSWSPTPSADHRHRRAAARLLLRPRPAGPHRHQRQSPLGGRTRAHRARRHVRAPVRASASLRRNQWSL